jgi:hypothetical protein
MNPWFHADLDDRVLPMEADTVDPYVYLCTRRRQILAEPELKLVFALLEDALRCVGKYLRTRGRKGRSAYRDTDAWIFSRDDDRVFSFGSVCEILGINPDYLRKGVAQWKKNFPIVEKSKPAQMDSLRARPRVISRRPARLRRRIRAERACQTRSRGPDGGSRRL